MPKSNKYAFVMYEESNPLPKVLDFLTVNHFAAVISPVHDDDEWTKEDVERWRESQKVLHNAYIPADATVWERPTGEYERGSYGQPVPQTETKLVPRVGETKKCHRHVYFEFDYSMPLKTALEKVAPLNINYLEVINSRRGYLRYLCHLDTPEKKTYRREDVISLGGVDISCLWSQDDGQKFEQDKRIREIIREQRMGSIEDLQGYLAKKDYRLMYSEVKAHYGYWMQVLRGGFYTFGEQPAKLTGDNTDGDTGAELAIVS